MINVFHLAAITKTSNLAKLVHIPLHQNLQDDLKENWNSQYESFIHETEEIDYDAGYKLEDSQCFRFLEFELPAWIALHNTHSITTLDVIDRDDRAFYSIQGTVAFTRINLDEELMLFQNFTRSKVIRPGRFMLLDGDTFKSTEHPGLMLDQKLSAIYIPNEKKLLFRDFRAVNSFLPLFDFFKELSEDEIREILQHDLLDTENPESWAKDANQWFRTRFTLLKHSGVLDLYSAKEIKRRSTGYDVSVQVANDKIVFPSDLASAKKLLQFLNEELFMGAITDTIYETNSKRKQIDQ